MSWAQVWTHLRGTLNTCKQWSTTASSAKCTYMKSKQIYWCSHWSKWRKPDFVNSCINLFVDNRLNKVLFHNDMSHVTKSQFNDFNALVTWRELMSLLSCSVTYTSTVCSPGSFPAVPHSLPPHSSLIYFTINHLNQTCGVSAFLGADHCFSIVCSLSDLTWQIYLGWFNAPDHSPSWKFHQSGTSSLTRWREQTIWSEIPTMSPGASAQYIHISDISVLTGVYVCKSWNWKQR